MDREVEEAEKKSEQVEEKSEESGAGEKNEQASDPPLPTAAAAEKKVSAAKSGKVEVRLQAAGDAPIMKQKNYKVDGEKKISWIIQFIRKYLKLEPTDSLFLYVNQAFSPSPDQTVCNLNECFGSADNKLVLYYSRSECWG